MWIAFIEINRSFSRAFAAAKELGAQILYITRNPEAQSQLNGIYDKIIILDDLDYQSVSTAVRSALPQGTPIAFWTLRDNLSPLSARLDTEFNNSPLREEHFQKVLVCKNKFLLREQLRNTPYNPQYQLLRREEILPLEDIRYPVVLKPLLGYASIGVELVSHSREFEDVLLRTFSAGNFISRNIKGMEEEELLKSKNIILMEEFIDGEEFSVEMFANSAGLHCMGICSKSPMSPPFFEEVSYCMPGDLSKDLAFRLEAAAADILSILGVRTGMAHMEFRVTNKKIKLLDIGLRLGGSGLTHDLVYASSGTDLVKAVIAETCGLESEKYLDSDRSDIGLLYLLQIRKGGVLKTLPSFGLNTPGAIQLSCTTFVNPGDNLTTYPNYSGLPGYAIFRVFGRASKSYVAAQNILRICERDLQLEYAA